MVCRYPVWRLSWVILRASGLGFLSVTEGRVEPAMIRRPEVGELVHVRSRQWVVNDLKASTLPAPATKADFSGPQNLISLSSVEDDGLGEELQVIWEVEPGARVIDKVAMPEPTGFDAPEKLDAFLDAVRWGASSTADVKNIQAPFRSGIEIEDYQLEEIIAAGGAIQHGKWSDRLPETRLHEALDAITDEMPSEKVQDVLLAIYPQLTAQLGQSLEARMKERKAAIHRTLSARAEKEAKDITAILTELKAAIEKELNDPEYRQLELFSDPEKEQFERNKDALRARVKEIPEEIKREVESIKSRFANPQVRLFPVAVTFLVPQKLK